MAFVSDPDIFNGSEEQQQYISFLQNQSSANNLFNAQQAQKQMDFQTAANAKMMDFNHKEAELNRDWQKMMSDTAYQRQVADMIASGLNPVLGISNSGASVGSGSTATGATSSGASATADTSVNAAMSNFVAALINGATSREVAHIQSAASMENAKVGAAASMYGADLASSATRYAAGVSAAASRYMADQSLLGTMANIEWQKEYNANYNPMAYLNEFMKYVTGKTNTSGAKAFASTVFDDIFGNTGIALTAKGGRTVHVNTVSALRDIYDNLTETSINILQKIASYKLKDVAYYADSTGTH